MTVKLCNMFVYYTMFKIITSFNGGFIENDDDNSEFKMQIASVLKRSVNFYIYEFGLFKDSFLMAPTFLDPRVRKFKKFKEKEALNAINNVKKYINL